MIRKALLTAIATGALSIPLAGMAWAEPPSDPNDPPGKGGVPAEAGDFLGPAKVTPGSVFSSIAQGPGNVPEGVRVFVNGFYGTSTNGFAEPIPPGIAIKSFTPSCGSGRTASDGDGGVPEPICH
jgi:hypothetical protein